MPPLLSPLAGVPIAEVGQGITKENKVHHRSRFRNAGLCNACVLTRSS